MKGINAAITFADKIGATLEIIWFTGWELNCPFHKLFAPINRDGITLREATFLDYILYDRPRRKNLHIPKLFQKIMFDKTMYESEAGERTSGKFDFTVWCDKKKHYIATFSEFCADEKRHVFEMFKPAKELEERIRQNVNRFSAHTIGVHIRRTDNVIAIEKSPTELFIRRMQEEIRQNQDAQFYLATDSEQEKKTLGEMFKGRITTSPFRADRNSVEGMQEAVVELYTLAATTHIIGSTGSTYARTAARIGKIEYEYVSKEASYTHTCPTSSITCKHSLR